MANFPIHQARQFDTSNMVVNWGDFGEKIMKGVVQGIGLGISIKKSREDTALNAMNLKAQQSLIDARAQEVAIAKIKATQEATEHELRTQKMQADNDVYLSQAAMDARDMQMQSEKQAIQLNLGLTAMTTAPEIREMKSILTKLPTLKNDPVGFKESYDRLAELNETPAASKYMEAKDQLNIIMAPNGRQLPASINIPSLTEVDNMLKDTQTWGTPTGRTVKTKLTHTDKDGLPVTSDVEVPEVLTPQQLYRKLPSDPDLAVKIMDQSSESERKKLVKYLIDNMSLEDRKVTGLKELVTGKEQVAIPEPVVPKTEEQRRAELKAQAPMPSASDLIDAARKSAMQFGKTAGYSLLELVTLPFSIPYNFGAWEVETAKKIPPAITKKLVDIYQNKWVDQQLQEQKPANPVKAATQIAATTTSETTRLWKPDENTWYDVPNKDVDAAIKAGYKKTQ